jgi:hypothetical protein
MKSPRPIGPFDVTRQMKMSKLVRIQDFDPPFGNVVPRDQMAL